jgi:hypothetical protein
MPVNEDYAAHHGQQADPPCPVRVKRVDFVMSAVRPVYPKQQTFLDPVGTSHLCQKQTRSYSITLSANCTTDAGIARLSALAVLRFRTNSNLVGCSTGKSAGFAPLKILSSKSAA